MKDDRRQVRRRKWKRFETVGGAVLLLNKTYLKGFLGIKRIEMGPIVNISMGGLAVQYVENKKRTAKYRELSIYIPADGIVIDRVPYEVIDDCEVARMPDEKAIRKQRVKFGALTTFHSVQLEQLINNHGAKCLADRRGGGDRRKVNDPRYQDDAYEEWVDRRSGEDRRK